MILQVIIGFVLPGCSNTGLQTYQNDNLQYAIDYPENWLIKKGQDPAALEPPVLFIAPHPSLARVAISVEQDSKYTPEQIIGFAEILQERGLTDYTTTIKEGKTERWDGQLEGHGTMEIGDIFVFAYYKQRENYLYKIEGMADSKIWDDLLIDKIVSSFRLL